MDNNFYKIDKGVPYPSNIKYGKWSRLASAMEVGDSVGLNSIEDIKSLRQAMYRLKYKSNALFQRSEIDGKYRVWRTS